MPVQQIVFDISHAIASKLLTGKCIQWDGIVCDQAGRIFKHLKPVQIECADKAFIGVTVAATAIAGVAAVYQHIRKNKQNAVEFSELNKMLTGYMSAIDEDNLSVEKLGKAIAAIDTVIERIDAEEVRVEIEGETFANLVRVIRAYTERLYDANSASFDGKAIQMPQASDDTLENLREYLKAQRSMFEIAARQQ